MKVDLITKTDAITVLSTFFPEENWQEIIGDHLDVSVAEGMELLLKEELIEFVVINAEALIEPVHARLFCSGMIAGIKAESNRHFHDELDQLLEVLGTTLEGSPAADVNQTNMTEVA